MAYSAEIKEDFLDAMDKFLDDSIVLPPGDWDEDLLLPIMHERNELRRRKREGVHEMEVILDYIAVYSMYSLSPSSPHTQKLHTL